MDFNNWSKCLNGTSTAWALLLLQALGSEARQSFSVKSDGHYVGYDNRTLPEQARINRARSNDGKNTKVEDTAPLDDAYDVNIGLAGSGVVHDPTRPNKPKRRCRNWGYDGCVRGLDQTQTDGVTP